MQKNFKLFIMFVKVSSTFTKSNGTLQKGHNNLSYGDFFVFKSS